jgi:hypothetical protein
MDREPRGSSDTLKARRANRVRRFDIGLQPDLLLQLPLFFFIESKFLPCNCL